MLRFIQCKGATVNGRYIVTCGRISASWLTFRPAGHNVSNMNKPSVTPSESSQFYRLVQEVTLRLVSARGVEIETAVDDCLAQLGKHFGVPSVSLGGISKTGELTSALRVWGGLPTRDKSLTIEPSPGPDMVARWCRDGSFMYSRLEDLDDLPQYQEHTKRMGAEAAVFWVYRDYGDHAEGIAISSPKPRTWPDDIVEQLGAIGEVLFNALHRRRAEIETERLQQFEHVIAEAASMFVQASPKNVDGYIFDTLGKICTCASADLGILLQWDRLDKSKMVVSHEWEANPSTNSRFRDTILADTYPWLAKQLHESKTIFISELSDFPHEAKAERKRCVEIGIQSLILVPIIATHDLNGYLALFTVSRPEFLLNRFVSQLGLIGNVIASAIEKRHADLALNEAHNEIKRLNDHIKAENFTLREEIKVAFNEDELVGKSHAFQTVLQQVKQVGPTGSTVLILGETGTGKGLVARTIHQQSARRDRPLVTINCAALPSSLIESELFGHEKGAFTGAVERKIGRFELADGGTIFLDEVGDLPIELQAKLLRVLQDYEFERLGSSVTRTVDTCVIAATNRDLDTLVEQGLFRADLFYRLGVFPIRVPPLRERRSDIPLLVWFFIVNLQPRLGKTIKNVSEQMMSALTEYEWPGNVRELRNIIERAMILASSSILDLVDFAPLRSETTGTSTTGINTEQSESLEDVQRAHILRVLKECDWRVRGKNGAAERLDLKRTTLQSRMKRLGIRRPPG